MSWVFKVCQECQRVHYLGQRRNECFGCGKGLHLADHEDQTKEGEPMLAFTRRDGESIVIDDRITVTVWHDRQGRIKVGIVAPREVPVHRAEVWEEIHGQPAPSDRKLQVEADVAEFIQRESA